MKQYQELLKHILKNGTRHEDRTGVGTISVFGYQTRYDLRAGFPIVTTKRVPFRWVAEELFWFLSGDTNEKNLQARGVDIWAEWADEEHTSRFGREAGDLGPIYGHQWTNWSSSPQLIVIEPRRKTPPSPNNSLMLLFPLEKIALNTNDANIGRVFTSHSSGKFKVLRETSKVDRKSKRHRYYDIQFLETGFIRRNVKSSLLREDANIKDPYFLSVNGVGCLGEYQVITDLDKHLKKLWLLMLERCYNPNSRIYKYYGAKGIFVDKRWLNFSNFRKDVELIPNWHNKRRDWTGYELDKDYYSSNCYSNETTVWLKIRDNNLYRNGKAFWVVTPEGKRIKEISVPKIAEEYNLNERCIRRVLDNQRSHHKGYQFHYIEDDKIYRYSLPIHQIADLIENIQKNPNSRRLIVTGWNPSEAEQVDLPPCHTLFQFKVENEKILHCQLYQRSADAFLGVPFNISSYALLTQIIAHVCDLDVGEFIHTFGDLHIYLNHLSQVEELLKREPLPLPKLEFVNAENLKGLEGLLDFKYENLNLIGYQSHKKIAAPVAV
jgi:thymidylate synthase